MVVTRPVSYAKVTQAAAETVKPIHGEFYGFTVISSAAGTITVRDGGASGTVIFTATGLTAGQVVHFGGCGILCNSDIYVAVGGTAEVTVLYV